MSGITSDAITLAHGAGGAAMDELITTVFRPAFDNPWLNEGEDQARLPLAELLQNPADRLAVTTDSYVITPLEFPGGDIGRLAVCGTLNDLAVGGATPRYLSAGFILEEGLSIPLLRRVVASMQQVAAAQGVVIVTGDTKVVPRGHGGELYINTTGIGVIPAECQLSQTAICPGDKLIVNGPVGNHGAVIADVRESLGFVSDLQSDCACLYPLINTILAEFPGQIRCLRDATRGGLAAVANEFARAAGMHLQFDESHVPVADPVTAMCELLGFDPLYLANEGNALWVVDSSAADAVVARMYALNTGSRAAVVGSVLDRCEKGRVTVRNALGTARLLDLPMGELLPRIC